MTSRRVAIVHPWVVEQRGAERVFFEIARMWPEADLHVLFHRNGAIPSDLMPRVSTSFLHKVAESPEWKAGYHTGRAVLECLTMLRSMGTPSA